MLAIKKCFFNSFHFSFFSSLGPSCGAFGLALGLFGPPLGSTWASWGHLGRFRPASLVAPCCSSLHLFTQRGVKRAKNGEIETIKKTCVFKAKMRYWGIFWASLDRLWAQLGPLGGVLGAICVSVGPLGGVLALSGRPLGFTLGHLEAAWRPWGLCLGPRSAILTIHSSIWVTRLHF